MLDRVGKLAYRLELPPLMKIYSVISIAQLESGKKVSNPYLREAQSMLEVEEDNTATNIFEIETLLGKRIVRESIQYLVK